MRDLHFLCAAAFLLQGCGAGGSGGEASGTGGSASRMAYITVNGSVVTYSPPAGVSGKTDRFVYAAGDVRGGVGAGAITIEIGN